MEDVVGEPYPPGSYEEALKDGTYLCKSVVVQICIVNKPWLWGVLA